MYCGTALKKAFNKPCFLCGKVIGYGNYHTVRTKPVRGKGNSFPGKDLYVHTECYNKECHQNLPIYDPYKKVNPPEFL